MTLKTGIKKGQKLHTKPCQEKIQQPTAAILAPKLFQCQKEPACEFYTETQRHRQNNFEFHTTTFLSPSRQGIHNKGQDYKTYKHKSIK